VNECVDCSINGNTDIVVIVDNTITINIDSCVEFCGTDPEGETYTIIIDGCLGTVCEPVECEIVILNPCLDPELYSIQPVELEEQHYTLFQQHTWTQQSFIVTGDASVIEMCGGLTYVIDGGDLNVYINYDESTQIITIYSENMDLTITGTFTYTVNVFLPGFEDSCGQCTACCGSSSGTIVIENPCSGATLTTGEVTSIHATYGVEVTFDFPALSVVPATCDQHVHYSCEYVSGPYTGSIPMCDFNL
jgi:hypothetical protein